MPLCLNVTASWAAAAWLHGSLAKASCLEEWPLPGRISTQGLGPAGAWTPGAWLGGFVFQTGTLEISSSVQLCPEVASVPVSGRVHPFLAAAEALRVLLLSSLAGQLPEGGGSGVGAGIFPP